LLVVAAAACLVLAALGLQSMRERRYPLTAPARATMYLRSAAAASRLALSFDALVADLYWIRAIQHYGGTRLSKSADKTYPLLYPLLDLTTSLDPRFSLAYRFGAIFLAESPPDGPGRPDWSLALLQKGLAANPGQWQYAMDIGFVHYWWLQDYTTAAAWFDRAASMPGASWWLRSLAATTLAEGGDRTSSRRMWQQILETADHEWLRNNARLRLAQLDAVDRMDQLALAVATFRSAAGRSPESWAALIRAGLVPGAPVDPSGVPFALDRGAPGGVALARTSPLYPLPPQFTQKASPPQ
jgi:tetratricopeptide (TPR) repeat protein